MAARRPGSVEIRGLADFQRELRALDRKLGSELRKSLKDAAEIVAEAARRKAQGLGGVIAKAGPSIKAQAEQRAAKVSFGSAKFPFAGGAFMGSIAYSQFRPWVGNTWRVGERGEGPYAINEAIADKEDELVEAVDDNLGRLAGRAFPRG